MASIAAWYRVSTDDQDTDNQVPDVERWATHHGHEIVREFRLSASAWNGSDGYTDTLNTALDSAWRGEFSILVVWSLDRLTRKGAEDTLRLIRKFRERGCLVVSVQESWLNGSPEVQDVLVAFAGWMAEQESRRRSERIKAGMAKRKAAGLPVGRQPGATDKGKRNRSGYVARWERERQS
jgi:DNA invertase Pin-like site-specific DNA recombinase